MSAQRPSARPAPLTAWVRLLIGMAALWAVVFRVGPWLQSFHPVAELHAFVEAQGIDATALYYTDSEEFGDIPLTVQNSLRR